MRQFRIAAASGRRPFVGLLSGWALCACLAFLAIGAEAQTPAGSRIVIRSTISYEYEGRSFAVTDSIVMIVGQVAGVDIDPARVATTEAGAKAVFSHTVINAGNGRDAIALSASSSTGWLIELYIDVDRDGAVGSADNLVTGPLVLAMGEAAAILAQVAVPDTPAMRGIVGWISINAVSGFDAGVSDSLVNELRVQGADIAITLGKSVDRPTATIGDVITYTITYATSGLGTAADFEIADLIPSGASYLAGTLRWNLRPLTDSGDADAGFVDTARNVIRFRLGIIAAGESGTVTFQVRVDN